MVYNGHKRVYAQTFQAVAAPNGLIANSYRPVEGRRLDSAILAMSFAPTGTIFCLTYLGNFM